MKKLFAIMLTLVAIFAVSSSLYGDDELEFEADLNAANVVSLTACASPAEGDGEFDYNPVTKLISYEIEFEDLLSPDTAAHLHAPAPPGVNAPALFTIAGAGPAPSPGPSPLGSPYEGTVGPLTVAQETDLLAGLFYFQIHTAVCGPGELRGQLLSELDEDSDENSDDD